MDGSYDVFFRDFVRACPNVIKFDIHLNSDVMLDTFHQIVINCSKLELLRFHWIGECGWIGRKTIDESISSIPRSLRCLDLKNWIISDESKIELLFQANANLEVVSCNDSVHIKSEMSTEIKSFLYCTDYLDCSSL